MSSSSTLSPQTEIAKDNYNSPNNQDNKSTLSNYSREIESDEKSTNPPPFEEVVQVLEEFIKEFVICQDI